MADSKYYTAKKLLNLHYWGLVVCLFVFIYYAYIQQGCIMLLGQYMTVRLLHCYKRLPFQIQCK